MNLTLKTWDGHDINDGGSYEAWIDDASPLTAEAEVIWGRRNGNWSKYLGKLYKNGRLVVNVAVRSGGDMDTLLGWFDLRSADEKRLVGEDGSGAGWYRDAVPIRLALKTPRTLQVTLAPADPYWRTSTENDTTWVVTGSGQTQSITPGGNVQTEPTFEVTPTAAKSGGFGYKKFVTVYNRKSWSFGDNYPLDLTAGGWNTASLVTAGKMQASGADVRVMVDGAEANFWLDGMNGAATKVWVSLALDRGREFVLAEGVAATGDVTAIKVVSDSAAIEAGAGIGERGIVQIGSELFTYTGIGSAQFEGVTRAAKGSSMGAHSAGDTVRWIEHDIWVLYGNSSVEAADVDDSRKPIFNLGTSSNTSWDYDDFLEEGAQRAGAWTPGKHGGSSNTKTFINTSGSAVADVMGMQVMNVQRGDRWQAENGNLYWAILLYAGCTTVSSSGRVKQSYSGDYPGTRGLYKSQDWRTWFQQWNEDAPSSTGYEAWSQAGVSLGGTWWYLAFNFSGGISASTINGTYFEVQDVTLTLDSGNVPGVTFGSEQANYLMELTLLNSLTGESFSGSAVMGLDDTWTIDTAGKTSRLPDGSSVGLSFSSVRFDWLGLVSGSPNELVYTNPGSGSAVVHVKWRDKKV